MDEEISSFIVHLPPGFPLDDVIAIGNELETSGGIVPGFLPPARGLFDVMAIKYSKAVGETIMILPDRNVVSRIVAIAEGRARYPLDPPSQLAADLMAFCQCMDLNFDPLIAFLELAHGEGNAEANRELAVFRIADDGKAMTWVDVSRGRSIGIGPLGSRSVPDHDLAAPWPRWERNYVVALRIARLELADMPPLERAFALLDWMMDDFFLAGPAAVFASMYFSPNAAKKRLIKQLRSADREKAIRGVRNAAWDMTHLSDFTRRMARAGDGPERFVFATGDRGLAEIASLLPIDAEPGGLPEELGRLMSVWWPPREADALAVRFANAIAVASSRPAPTGPPNETDPIGRLIAEGERAVKAWRPGGRDVDQAFDAGKD